MAVLCAFTTCLWTLPLIPLLHQRPAFRPLLKLLAAAVLVSLLLSASLGHAYTKDSPKRIVLQHASHLVHQAPQGAHGAQGGPAQPSSFVAVASLDRIPPHADIFEGIHLLVIVVVNNE